MTNKVMISVLFLSTVTNFNCFASDYADLDEFIVTAKSITRSVSGTSVVLIKDGQIVHEIHSGMADVENQIPVDTNSVYYFASATKAIMGLATLLAEKNGLLTKNSTLKQLFPTIKFRYIDPNNYSVRDLLSHTSGLTNEAMTWTFSYTGNHSRNQRLSFLESLKQHPEINKGEFDYTNLGYNLMAIWFDENFEGGWSNALDKLVLSPARMKNSTADVDQARTEKWPIPKPYTYKFGNGQKEIYMNKNNATLFSVGIFSRPNDWARFMSNLLPINTGESVFPQSVVDESQRLLISDIDSYFSGYGWGWMHSKIAGEKVLMHTGGFDGASVEVSYSPKRNIGVVIVHNESGLIANELNSSISEIAYKLLLDKDVKEIIGSDAEEMKDVAQFVEKSKMELDAKRESLSKQNNLSPELISLVKGTYENSEVGTIKLKETSGELYLFWGNLQSKIYSGLLNDEYVVELRPGKFFEMKLEQKKSVIKLKGWRFDKKECINTITCDDQIKER